MPLCSYCDRPLTCDACGAEFAPVTPEQYEALSRPEVPLNCQACEAPLVCHWCRTPYDGRGDGDGEADDF